MEAEVVTALNRIADAIFALANSQAAAPKVGAVTSAVMPNHQASRPAVAKAKPGEVLLPNYGDFARQPVSAATDEALKKYAWGVSKSLSDPTKAQYAAANEKMLKAIQEEQSRRVGNHEVQSALNELPDDDIPY